MRQAPRIGILANRKLVARDSAFAGRASRGGPGGGLPGLAAGSRFVCTGGPTEPIDLTRRLDANVLQSTRARSRLYE